MIESHRGYNTAMGNCDKRQTNKQTNRTWGMFYWYQTKLKFVLVDLVSELMKDSLITKNPENSSTKPIWSLNKHLPCTINNKYNVHVYCTSLYIILYKGIRHKHKHKDVNSHKWDKHEVKDTCRNSVSPQFQSPSWVTVRVELDTFFSCLLTKNTSTSLVLVLVLVLMLALSQFTSTTHAQEEKSSTFLCLHLCLCCPSSHILFVLMLMSKVWTSLNNCVPN